MHSHPDRPFVTYLLSGLSKGFHTGIHPIPEESIECLNNRSALRDPETVTHLIQKDLQEGYVIGPFTQVPFKYYRVNPLSLAEKKYTGKKRLVLDLSAPHDDPENTSLNDLIDKDDFSLSYVTIDDAIKVIQNV